MNPTRLQRRTEPFHERFGKAAFAQRTGHGGVVQDASRTISKTTGMILRTGHTVSESRKRFRTAGQHGVNKGVDRALLSRVLIDCSTTNQGLVVYWHALIIASGFVR
jgi:hypothetical protein